MAEKDFQAELMRGLAVVGGHAHKIADVPHKIGQQARFIPKKPYDCYWVFEDAFHALELKQVSSGLSFGLAALADHQEESLLEVERAGGYGFLVVNFRVRLSKTQKAKRGVDLIDVAYAARIQRVVEARTQEARTGLPLEWFEAQHLQLYPVNTPHGMGWNPLNLSLS